jgi:hypothetical protein
MYHSNAISYLLILRSQLCSTAPLPLAQIECIDLGDNIKCVLHDRIELVDRSANINSIIRDRRVRFFSYE